MSGWKHLGVSQQGPVLGQFKECLNGLEAHYGQSGAKIKKIF